MAELVMTQMTLKREAAVMFRSLYNMVLIRLQMQGYTVLQPETLCRANRKRKTYQGKSITAANLHDLETARQTKASMKGKPVIVVVDASKPFIPAEFEKDTNAIVVEFGVQNQAILDILTGAAEPSALLSVQLPANMKTVELKNEDIPHDMICYTDAAGHTYDFGYGMNWKGAIKDARTLKYIDLAKPAISVTGNLASIRNTTPGTQVYYTVNGATPAFTDAELYSKPFIVQTGTTIKAITKKYGVNNSSMVTYNFRGEN